MIEVKNVTKKYGGFYALRNVSFEVGDGEIVGFLGRNGAGKTTTMNIITGFIEATEGDVLVGGYSINLKPKKVKAQIGYMPEGTPLYSELTVREFIEYMAYLKNIKKKDIKEAVDKAIKEAGLETVQNNLTKNLSRGFKQRTSIAGTIVGDPDILILDEPTVGLDPKQVVEIRKLIRSFKGKHTVLVSSHILSEVSQMCDKVIIIDKGEIVKVDSTQNLERGTKDNSQIIEVAVEDSKNNFEKISKDLSDIKEAKLKNTNEDGSKLYIVTTNTKEDIRKKIFKYCADHDVMIIEMKESDVSLEEAFIDIVDNRKEYSYKEIKKQQYEKEIEELRKEEEEKKARKAERKQARKEEKARKAAEKEAKKNKKEEGGNK